MHHLSKLINFRKVLLAISFGILGLLLSPFGIAVDWGKVVIDLPWSVLFPIIIAMAFGWRYGLLSGLSGGALFPFLLWANNGWPNLFTTLCYLSIYTLLGLSCNRTIFPKVKLLIVRLLVIFSISGLILSLYYNFLFGRLLSFNPPFWNSNTINQLDQGIIDGFAMKDFINIIIMSVVAEACLNLPFVRRLLRIDILPENNGNNRIFILSLATSFLIWLSFVGLGSALLRNDLSTEHISLAFLVIMASGFLVSRMLFYYNANQILIKKELNASEEKYRLLVENQTDLIVRVDKDGNFQYVSPSYCKLFGKKDYELLGKSFVPLVHEDDIESTKEEMKKLYNYPYCCQVEQRAMTVNGWCWLSWVDTAVLNEKNEVVFIIGVGRDIAKQKEAELELIKAKESAEESDRLKTAFLQNMSHEIRTPMNAIMGFSGLLSKNFNNSEKLEKFSSIIESRCNDLLTIINDILDISKIESGQSSINIETCNIKELFEELDVFFKDYKIRINKQDIKVEFCSGSEDPLMAIKTDTLKLKQILINLVSNALKFTEKGSVLCGYKQENSKLQFWVKDTGVGIPEDKFDFIFERFSQLRHASLQNAGGTGLGLPIVKGLVKLLGGDVWLESVYNKGTTFYFTIDYVEADSDNLKKSSFENSDEINTDKTILIVEDDAYNAEYLKEVLGKVSSHIITASSGMSAVKVAREQNIDLILMDISLPDISGYEATRLILLDNPGIKIIAQTDNAANTEHQKAMDAGCVDYISQPTKEKKLLTMLNKYLK